jgi:hypothetical protein
MKFDWKVKAIVAVVALAAAVFVGKIILDYHDEALLLRAELSQLKAQQNTIKQETKQKVEEKKVPFEQARKNPSTMGDVIAHEVPFGIEQIPNQVPDADAPPEIRIAASETPEFLAYVERCSICEIELAGAKKEIANLEEQNKKLEKLKNRHWYQSPKLWFTVGAVGTAVAIEALDND